MTPSHTIAVDQTRFVEALFDPERPAPEGLVDPVGRPAAARFDVYRNNVIVSLTNALTEAFPAVAGVLGESNFRILARRFVHMHPPKTPVIALYGTEFPAFLESFEPVASLPYLPDVARLESALRHSYHAADSTPADLTQFAEFAPDQIAQTRLTFAASIALVCSPWPIYDIRRFTLEGGAKPQMAAQDVLITRPEFDPVLQVLPAGGATWIKAMQTGCTIAHAAQAAEAETPDFELSATLGLLVAGHAITQITPPESD